MKNKRKIPPPYIVMAVCIIFTVIWSATPISASVTDNLQSIVVKILGQKNETTTKSNYSNASTNAKLNYLESEIANLKTKVEIVNSVPERIENGTIEGGAGTYKTLTGSGVVYIDADGDYTVTADGYTLSWGHHGANSFWLYMINNQIVRIPFKENITITKKDSYELAYAWYSH